MDLQCVDSSWALRSCSSRWKQCCGDQRERDSSRPNDAELFHQLYALGDGSANAIYLGDEIVGRNSGARVARCCVSDVEFGNLMGGGAWMGQIGSDPGGSAALESRGAGSWVHGNRRL